MPKRTNKIQVCKIQGKEPIVRLKGWTPAGSYKKLTEATEEKLGSLRSEDYTQYQEIGEATVDTETGEVLELTLL